MNVPISEEPVGNNADDIWQRHESKIRCLYQAKGLKEVMTFMESTPGFPKLELKTLIEKLGNIGIRKTVKNEEWAKIYQHIARYRLKDPTQVRGGNGVEKTNGKKGDKRWKKMIKDTDVMLGIKTIRWEEVWRNLRRAGAIVDLQPDPPSPLPADILIQTPRSVPSPQSPHSPFETSRPRDESITTIQSQELSLTFEPSTPQHGITCLGGGQRSIQQSGLQTPSSNNPFPSTCSTLSDSMKAQMMLHLPLLPIWSFSNAFVQMANLEVPIRRAACDPWYNVTTITTPSTILPIKTPLLLGPAMSNDSVFQPSDLFSSLILTQSPAALAAFSPEQMAYIKVATTIYLLSNNLVDISNIESSIYKSFFEALDWIFAKIPARHLQALLKSRLPTARAALEALLKIAGIFEQRVAFKSLVRIGISNNWIPISMYGHQLLYNAVRMDLDDVVQQLLEIGCREDKHLVRYASEDSAIAEALERHNIQCVKLLLKDCNVNNPIGDDCYFTSFTLFVERTLHLDEMRFGQGIQLFLDAGAEINTPLHHHTDAPGYEDHPVQWEWRKTLTWTVRDYLFCFHPNLFYQYLPNWTPAQDLWATRAGFLTSLELGPNALGDYYTKLAQIVSSESLDEYLKLLVVEQLTGYGPWYNLRRREVDLKTVAALVDFVSMDNVLTRAPHLLANCMQGRSDCALDVIRYLLDNGATVDDGALMHAVRSQDTRLVALLIRNTPNIRRQGLPAFVAAAKASNFEAVKMLIDAGVNVNAEFHIETDQRTSLLGHIVTLWDSSFEELSNMIDFLVQRGAHFRLSASRPHLHDLLDDVIYDYYYYHNNNGLRKRIAKHIIDAGCDLSDPDSRSARLLENCCFVGEGNDEEDRMEIFEYMIRNGALLRPGAPLAAWISLGGGANLANQMLRGGADIDAYYDPHRGSTRGTALQAAAARGSTELVALLLQNRPVANVNAPARGRYGQTALQAVCSYNPESPAEKEQQIAIINLLISYGANINAAPARHGGRTALQYAAEQGNLQVIMHLLAYNPPVDINAPPCRIAPLFRPHGNAVYLAAAGGRLDVVKLLLENGGLSTTPGDSSYYGAIRVAEDNGFLAVAELIREHANTPHMYLLQPDRHWHEYGYDDYSDGYTTCSGEDFDMEWHCEGTVSAAPSEEQDSMLQAQVQPSADETPRAAGPEHAAPEPGRAWEEQDDNFFNLDISFDNFAGYDLHPDPTTTHIDIAATGSGFDQWNFTGPNSIEELEVQVSDAYDAGRLWSTGNMFL